MENMIAANDNKIIDNKKTTSFILNVKHGYIDFSEIQLKDVQKKVEALAINTARNVPLDEILPDPLPGEEEYIRSIFAGSDCEDWEKTLQETSSQCISFRMVFTINEALSEYDYDKNIHKIKDDDVHALKIVFVKAFIHESFMLVPKNPLGARFIAALETKLKALFASSVSKF